MKTLIITIFTVLLSGSLLINAQNPGRGSFQGNMPNDAKVTGIIADGSNSQPVQYASVAIYRAKDSTLVSGAMTNADGSFDIENMPYGRFYIKVTFLGYKTQLVNSIALFPQKKEASIGTIKLNPSSNALKAVEIVGSTPPVSYQIDKKVVNIAQALTAAGGTLADALQNAPSIQTDVQGNVTLRGSSNFILLIDGRPAPVAGSEGLQQIPANLVESVEIITNPSAKYEAEGSAGILNVIMKKQKVQGSSGMINATAGTGDKYSTNISLNYKLSKFNFTLGADYTDMKFHVKNSSNSTDTLKGDTLKYETVNGSGAFHRQGMGINGAIDYIIDDKNSITLTGSIGTRTFSRPISSDYLDAYSYNSTLLKNVYYTNSSTPEFKRNYKSLNLDYLLKLNNKGHQLSASAYYSGGPDNNSSILLQDTTDSNWKSLNLKQLNQHSAQNSDETDFRTKIDYALPIGEKGKLEAGYQGTYSNSTGNSYLENYDGEKLKFVMDSSQTDNLNFRDQLQAGYVTLSNSTHLLDYMIGLRAEYENRQLNEVIQDKQYKVDRLDYFPSVHLSKQLPWGLQIQASYTRRTNRPRPFNTNPFVLRLGPNTIRVGNPGLLPEFSNSYELNLQKKLTESSFISLEGYVRQTNHLIQQITTLNQATDIDTITFQNIDHDRSMGTELMVYLEPVKWFNLNSSFNIYNYHMFGTPIPSVASSINTWNVRINPTFHLGKSTSVQVSYAYNAPTRTAQGNRSGFYFSTLGIRQGLLKQKASLTLQMRDLVGTTNFINTTYSDHQFSYSRFQRESKVVMLTFSYRINNYKVKQNNRQNPDDTGGNGDQDMNQGL